MLRQGIRLLRARHCRGGCCRLGRKRMAPSVCANCRPDAGPDAMSNAKALTPVMRAA